MNIERARLLVVDDDAELRELAQAYLKQQGFDVVTVPDAPRMDAVLANNTFDLIILDLVLPGEDGLSIAKRLKSGLNVPIIIVWHRVKTSIDGWPRNRRGRLHCRSRSARARANSRRAPPRAESTVGA